MTCLTRRSKLSINSSWWYFETAFVVIGQALLKLVKFRLPQSGIELSRREFEDPGNRYALCSDDIGYRGSTASFNSG